MNDSFSNDSNENEWQNNNHVKWIIAICNIPSFNDSLEAFHYVERNNEKANDSSVRWTCVSFIVHYSCRSRFSLHVLGKLYFVGKLSFICANNIESRKEKSDQNLFSTPIFTANDLWNIASSGQQLHMKK